MDVPYDYASDPTLGLALRIARRADELARRNRTSAVDVQPWLRAEEEILGLKLPQPRLHEMTAPEELAAISAG